MLLSVIIPSFQQSALLRDALKSVQQQTFKDYEVVIMDGGSKDDTASVVDEFGEMPIKFYSERDNGIYDAMNKGIEHSTGDYLYFMGCDDSLVSKTVLEEVFSLPNITNNDVIYGDVIFSGEGNVYGGEFTHFKLIRLNICHQGIFTHKRVFEKLGKFEIRYKAYADWEFNMRWFDSSQIKRQYIPLVIANYNTSGFSSALQDDVFFAEVEGLRKKYFPRIVGYLVDNADRPFHWKLIRALTFKRLMLLRKLTKTIG